MDLTPWLTRHQRKLPVTQIAAGAFGAALTIALLRFLSDQTETYLLAASFGSSCVLVYSFPTSATAQPANVVGGHVVGTLSAMVVAALTPVTWWSVGIALGVSLAAMATLRVTHGPAGATALIVVATDPPWTYVFEPVLIGAICVVVLASLLLRLDGLRYPTMNVDDTRTADEMRPDHG